MKYESTKFEVTCHRDGEIEVEATRYDGDTTEWSLIARWIGQPADYEPMAAEVECVWLALTEAMVQSRGVQLAFPLG